MLAEELYLLVVNASNLDKDYTQNDLSAIAKGQLASEHNFQLLDTDLITIKIWSEYKYGNCEKWILDTIEKQKTEKRFYLLCTPDIPWEADPQRENPISRDELFEIYKTELKRFGHQYIVVKGSDRVKNLLKNLNLLLNL